MRRQKSTLLLLILCVTICGCSREKQVDDKTWKKSFDDGFAALKINDFSRAEASYRDALNTVRQSNRSDIRLPKTYDALGEVYSMQGKTEDARRAYFNAYAEYKKLWSAPATSVDKRDYALQLATDTLHLANIARDSLRLDDAERLYDEALSVEESALGSDELKGEILEGKVKLFKLTGRTAEAEKIQSQVADLKAVPSVEETRNLSWRGLNASGESALQSGNLAKAQKLFEAAIERATKPVQRADSMRGLAKIFGQRKEYNPAIAKLDEARQMLLHGDEHRWALSDNYTTAGKIYFEAKDFAKSEQNYLHAVHLLKLSERKDADRARLVYQGLTKTESEAGKYADAEKFAKETLALTIQWYGKKGNRYPEDLLAVAILEGKQNKNAEATKGFLEVISLEEQDPSPRYMLAALDSYAKFLRDTKQDAQADAIELRAKNLRAEFE